jgi:trigger factor
MKNVHEKEIEYKGKEWQSILDEVLTKKLKDVRIDGFRKGKCPKDVYLKRVGIETLFMDAADLASKKAYMEVLKDKELVPFIEPRLDLKAIDKDHIVLSFTIITKPEVKLGKYKDLGIKKEAVKVTKKEIDEEIARVSSKLADIVVKENGEVLEGNTAVIDFEGVVDGKPLEGGNGANYPLEIGSHTFIPGFEEGIVGMKVGETKELNLKFPDNYVEELKNKDVTFKVTVREIKERVLPEMNEDFYKDLGYDNIKTEEEFRSEIEKVLKEKKEHEAEDKYLDAVIDKAIDNMKVEINDEIIDEEIDRILKNFEQRIKMQGITLEQYVQFTGSTMDQMREQVKPEADKQVKMRLLVEAIAEAEDIKVTDKEAKERAKEIAEQYGMTEEQVLEEFGGLEVAKYDCRMNKALKVLKGE